jgi:predicted N-acyltransferase
VRFIRSIADIDARLWNALAGEDYPFLRHEFLLALEQSQCTTARTGWQPFHVLVETTGSEHPALIALMPLYLKTNSMGEYVFDWAWADAYQRHGLDYYPKFLTAIPFTPCAGPRLCIAQSADGAHITALVHAAVLAQAEKLRVSSWHVLFPQPPLRDSLVAQGDLLRTGCQYQWFNQGYQDFDAFLATFASRKRKNLRKERSTVAAAGIQLVAVEGADISPLQWEQFYEFYAITYHVRGRKPYLNANFFQQLGQTMPERLLLMLAMRGDEAVAGALFFKGSDALYGRYWGAREDVPCLHFETCYYQGIDYCIRHGLKRMDSGAQGEHKIQRGFSPVPTWSTHWIGHPDFRRAIEHYVREEEQHLGDYMQRAAAYLPFRKDLQL